MADKMEAITVDYEKDAKLLAYIQTLEDHLSAIKATLQASKRKLNMLGVLNIVAAKIKADFPYAHEMLDKAYRRAQYTPGTKYRLGAFMDSQNMICVHHNLLAGAAVDYFKTGKGKIKFITPVDMRFMADTQQDLIEETTGGHGYLTLKYQDADDHQMKHCILDATLGSAVELDEVLKKKREKSPAVNRYLFSMLRFLFQQENRQDDAFIASVFKAARSEPNIRGVLQQLHRMLKGDPAFIRRFERFRVAANLDW